MAEMKPNKLKGFRGMYGITQDECAEKIEMSKSTFKFKERKDNFNKTEMLKILEFAKTYDPNITINDLFF